MKVEIKIMDIRNPTKENYLSVALYKKIHETIDSFCEKHEEHHASDILNAVTNTLKTIYTGIARELDKKNRDNFLKDTQRVLDHLMAIVESESMNKEKLN